MVLFTSLFLLSGCTENQANVDRVQTPYEVTYNGQTLSYYDTKDQINISNFNILENNLQNYRDKSNNVLVNEDGVIRYISVTTSDIVTYSSIHVGDSIKKITDSFSFEYQSGNNYMVIFDGESEENPANQNKNENWLWINYITDGTQITQIQIYDVKFGSEMR